MVNLQKSNFSNCFYINYGYILKGVPLGCLRMHTYKRVGSPDKDERARIDELLDFDSNISDEVRTQELRNVLFEKLLQPLNMVNTEADLLDEIKILPIVP